jgi:hypothetical protein
MASRSIFGSMIKRATAKSEVVDIPAGSDAARELSAIVDVFHNDRAKLTRS